MTTSRDIIQRGGVSFGASSVRDLVTDLNDALCMAYCLGFLDAIRDAGEGPVALGVDLRPTQPAHRRRVHYGDPQCRSRSRVLRRLAHTRASEFCNRGKYASDHGHR